MYQTRHFRWKVVHTLTILAHVGLTIAASVGYIQQLGKSTSFPATAWSHPRTQTAIATSSCSLALVDRPGSGYMLATAVPSTHPAPVLLACLIVGPLGFALNTLLLVLLLAVEPNRITLTEGEQHWRKQVVTFFGCLLNLILAGAGLRLAVTLGTHTAESKMMVGPLMWTAIQVALAILTAALDAVKNYREGQDLLD